MKIKEEKLFELNVDQQMTNMMKLVDTTMTETK